MNPTQSKYMKIMLQLYNRYKHEFDIAWQQCGIGFFIGLIDHYCGRALRVSVCARRMRYCRWERFEHAVASTMTISNKGVVKERKEREKERKKEKKKKGIHEILDKMYLGVLTSTSIGISRSVQVDATTSIQTSVPATCTICKLIQRHAFGYKKGQLPSLALIPFLYIPMAVKSS